MITTLLKLLTRPTIPPRSPNQQATVDAASAGLTLFYFQTCPYCIKVRRVLRQLRLDLELRNISTSPANRLQLVQGGGKSMVPCLRIRRTDGSYEWLYESSAISQYLEHQFAGR